MTDESTERLAVDLDGAFPDLVRAYQDRLYGFALRLMNSPHDAEESIQDAFVRAYRALERYPVDRRRSLQVRPWLYRITLNVVRNRVRRPRIVTTDVDGPIGQSLAANRSEEPEEVVERAERRHRLARAISHLPERYATAVVLRHVQGLSYAEAAEVLEQPVGTTKSDVHRGVRMLREVLERDPRDVADEEDMLT
ncbi:MAG: sigma-70 family RNA polymerase sigma factor, partial [Chloroflexi bacterium]|nr:sigma-70 family RNA polymerase sigma factor [Chloroflexota bacterium]